MRAEHDEGRARPRRTVDAIALDRGGRRQQGLTVIGDPDRAGVDLLEALGEAAAASAP